MCNQIDMPCTPSLLLLYSQKRVNQIPQEPPCPHSSTHKALHPTHLQRFKTKANIRKTLSHRWSATLVATPCLVLKHPRTGPNQGNMQVYICLSDVFKVVDYLLPCNAVLKVVHCLRQRSHRSCIGCGCQCLKQTHCVWYVGKAVDCIQRLLRQSQDLQPAHS